MSFSYSTVEHTFLNADGTPASGTLEFTLEQTLTNGNVTMCAGTHVTAQLDASGNLSQSLVSTQDPDTYSQGLAQWRSDERINGAPIRTTYLQVPSGGMSVDYGALIQTGQGFG